MSARCTMLGPATCHWRFFIAVCDPPDGSMLEIQWLFRLQIVEAYDLSYRARGSLRLPGVRTFVVGTAGVILNTSDRSLTPHTWQPSNPVTSCVSNQAVLK